jgi:nitrous oxidase accessory protein NosD
VARASVAGILAGAGANAVVRHNHVSDARVGIATIARAAARIENNLIDGETLAAISVASTGHVEVSHNRLLGSDRHIHAIEGADLVLGQNFSA